MEFQEQPHPTSSQKKSQEIQTSNLENKNFQQHEQVTQETLQRFNQICLDATAVMNEYKNQSISLKEQISSLVTAYQKSSSGSDVVPVQKIISITNQYQQGMKEANKEYNYLAEELKQQEKERDDIMLQIKGCFAKLESVQIKIKEKKRKQKEEKQKLAQNEKPKSEQKPQKDISDNKQTTQIQTKKQ